MGSLRIPSEELKSNAAVIISLQRENVKDEDARWQCHTSGGWTDCDSHAQKALSQAAKDGVTRIQLGRGARKYEYDIQELTRLNIKSQKMRPLRRQCPGISSESSTRAPSSPSHESADDQKLPAELEAHQELWGEGSPQDQHFFEAGQGQSADALIVRNDFNYPETQELPGGQYIGEAIDRVAHGKGCLFLDDGSIFIGSFCVGKATGKAVRFHLENNHIMMGSWRNGRPHGACLECSQTSTLLAAYKDGDPLGQGVLSGRHVFFGPHHMHYLRKAPDPLYVINMSKSVVNAHAEIWASLSGKLAEDLQPMDNIQAVFQKAMLRLELMLPCENDFKVPKELLQTANFVPHQAESPETLYEIKHAAGKGLGMFARRRIAAQQRIIVETPLIIPKTFKEAKSMALNLTGPSADAFWKLHDNFARDGQSKEAGGIILSNAIPCWPHSTEVGGVHGIISRANHSCKPNARMFWEPLSGQSVLLATRSILCGEEICISYLRGERWTRARRISYLQSCFGFECGCCDCNVDVSKQKENDTRQVVMEQLQKCIPLLKGQPVLGLRASIRLLRLLLEDTPIADFCRLAHHIARICLNSYCFALEVTSPDHAEAWLTMYARCMTLAEGQGSAESRRAHRLRETLLNNETWIGSGNAGVLFHSNLAHILLQPQELSGPFDPKLYGARSLVPCR
eukprot:gnl/MRDRNA2_/MRDRNA2_171581_c0_seq1.p1 gnl/MRDRNA2_/MRDRNA2_171581_c0~~gnl/MRDRNA2_/MRDRNA2_171581_c0_seq1.p1  ORF type:complete len:683 (+),score=102.38 gnl/MRDRNA2_/MRDRNA2_171581_c0_seq1:109-2157(+)